MNHNKPNFMKPNQKFSMIPKDTTNPKSMLYMQKFVPSAEPISPNELHTSNERIAKRAYEIWNQQGQPTGQALDHWLQAEVELRGQK